MLTEVNIENFALIERLTIRFGLGFNVLTGETGAGKSIVIDAIGAVLGERMGADVIRAGAARSVVEAVFDLEGCPARLSELRDSGILDPGETVVGVSRDFSGSGKTQARVNGRSSPIGTLREVGNNLVDIHGQHEHQSLLNPRRHLDILDDWCGSEALHLRSQCQELDARKGAIGRDLASLRMNEREKARRLDLLRFQANEIDLAGLSPDEEDTLLVERNRLVNMERLIANVAQARSLLTGSDDQQVGAVDALAKGALLIQESVRDDAALISVSEALQGAVYAARDVVQDLAAYHEGLETNPDRLEELDDRLACVRSLKRKYGSTVEEILAFRQEIEGEISQIEGADEREAELSLALSSLEKELSNTAERLTAVRQMGARDLEGRIGSELADVALAGAQFSVSIEAKDSGATGADTVEFLFSANPGEPARSLARIASGGEMSRIMLALKTLLASSIGVPTVIFDEIDVGVGGRTGEAIGQKLSALGSVAQVICVTHLPQVAAEADHHFHVRKRVVDGRTTVQVEELGEDERVEELSRMLGGGRDTALGHARDMRRRRGRPAEVHMSQTVLFGLDA